MGWMMWDVAGIRWILDWTVSADDKTLKVEISMLGMECREESNIEEEGRKKQEYNNYNSSSGSPSASASDPSS